MSSKVVELLFQSWRDLDHVIEGLEARDAESRFAGLSRVAWTVGHLGQQIDSWINVRFAGKVADPVLGDPMFHTGASGDTLAWEVVREAMLEIRQSAKMYLDGINEDQLNLVLPYDGSIQYLRPDGLRLSYALMRCTAHHFEHTGEIQAIGRCWGMLSRIRGCGERR